MKNKNKNNRFSESQLAQLTMAREAGIKHSECEKHPEWGPTLMNMCWNYERQGKSLEPVYCMADWLNQNLPRDEQTGLLYDDLMVLHHVLSYYERNGANSAGPKCYKAPDGSFDKYMLLYHATRDKLLADGAYMLYSGRVSVNNAGWLDLEDLMGEGIKKAREICTSLQSWAADKSSKNNIRPSDPMSERAFAMHSIMLALDDMNIRGYQLIYALEYCDDMFEALHQHILDNRSEDLCRYINMRSAKDYLAGDLTHNQIAVTHGASFQHDNHTGYAMHEPIALNMTEKSAQKFITDAITPIQVDYSKLDIMARVDIDQALKICEARNFKLIRRVVRPNKLDGNKTVESLILYNPDTHDYIYAPAAEIENINYGGMYLIIHRKFRHNQHGWKWRCSCGPLRNQEGSYFEFTQHDGLFRNYNETLVCAAECDQDLDWGKIGFGSYGIPIPTYFDLPIMPQQELYKKLGGQIANMLDNMGSYHISMLVNYIIALYDDALKNSGSPHYTKYYHDWFIREGMFHAASIGFECDDQFIMTCNTVFTWLQVPEDLIQKFMANDEAYFAQNQFVKRKPGWYNKIKARISNHDSTARKIIQAYDLPDPRTLPIQLPWLV